MALEPEHIEKLKRLKSQCEGMYPDKEGALSVMVGILLSSRLWNENKERLISDGIIQTDPMDPQYRQFMNAFMSGAKAMYETAVSGNLEPHIDAILDTLSRQELNDE